MTYFRAWGGSVTDVDPDEYIPDKVPTIGHFARTASLVPSRPVKLSGLEKGTVIWRGITLAEYIYMYDIWNEEKNSYGSFRIPPQADDPAAWASWRTVRAYALQPTVVFRGANVHDVNWRIIIVPTPEE